MIKGAQIGRISGEIQKGFKSYSRDWAFKKGVLYISKMWKKEIAVQSWDSRSPLGRIRGIIQRPKFP